MSQSILPGVQIPVPVAVSHHCNPFQLIFESMQEDQLSRGQQQDVDAHSTQLLSNTEQKIVNDEDPNNANGSIAIALAALETAVKGDSTTPNYSAVVTQCQQQLQVVTNNATNQQSQSDGATQQMSNATGQVSSDMAQGTQLAATIFSILSTTAGIMSSHY